MVAKLKDLSFTILKGHQGPRCPQCGGRTVRSTVYGSPVAMCTPCMYPQILNTYSLSDAQKAVTI